MLAGLILVVVAVSVGEWVAPDAEQQGQVLKTMTQNNQVILRAKYGLWLREGKQFINVRQIEDNGDLTDISIFELSDQQQLVLATHAEQAIFQGDKQWQLKQLKQSEISTEQMLASTEPDKIWKSSIDPDLLKIVVVNANNLSLYDLAMYVRFLKENHQKSKSYEFAFWGRVVNPLVIFVMLLVSAPIVIGVKRGVSAGARILIGAVIGLGFNVIDMTVGQMGLIYDLNPPLMAFLPSLIFLIGAGYFLRRQYQ
jgi:lipopolysaccharide export system permease protein